MNNVTQNIEKQANQLAKEIQPERDLWPGVELAINQTKVPNIEPPKSRFRPLAIAATILLASVISWSQFQQQASKPQNIAKWMNQEFNQQKHSLLVSFGNPNLNQLEPQMQQQLNTLKQAQQSIQQALEDDPDNMALIHLLQYTQQQELNLLTQIYRPKWQSI